MAVLDVAIIGGGIVGLATAYRLQQCFPNLRIAVLEKEDVVGSHQTGHNSGVLHSGIYYKPGSLRATNCRDGKVAMEQFCAEHSVPYDVCGKVIVALDQPESERLDGILERGKANGINCRLIDRDELLELEPHAAGIRAIHVPESGIVDYRQVCTRLSELITQRGATVHTQARVTKIGHQSDSVVVSSTAGDFEARYMVNCTGLYSDRVAKLGGQNSSDAKIVPFRGEYFQLLPEAQHLCRNLIYPVPNPAFPFLGVHFTRMIQGGIECGPNAVPAFAREGYRKTDVNFADIFDWMTYPGFLRLAAKHWKMGAGELWRSFSKRAFVKALQRLMPDIREEHLVPCPAGVRAMALGRDGSLLDDFVILESERIVDVCNAPSPAATASLNIGRLIVDKLSSRFE